MVEDGQALTVIETKSGQTVTNDMLSPVRSVASALTGAGKIATVVVHGGDELQHRSGIDVLPWSRLHERRW